MKVHLNKGGRSPCRYSSRPSRKVVMLDIQAFADTPVDRRCTECNAKYKAICDAREDQRPKGRD